MSLLDILCVIAAAEILVIFWLKYYRKQMRKQNAEERYAEFQRLRELQRNEIFGVFGLPPETINCRCTVEPLFEADMGTPRIPRPTRGENLRM